MLASNVVEKLRISLGIPDSTVAHNKLRKFFREKFTPKEAKEFDHFMPDLPELEMVQSEMFGYDTLTPAQGKKKLGYEAARLRE